MFVLLICEYSTCGLKHENLRLSNAHTFISSIYGLCHIAIILTRNACIRANITFSGQICSDVTRLSQAIAHSCRYTKKKRKCVSIHEYCTPSVCFHHSVFIMFFVYNNGSLKCRHQHYVSLCLVYYCTEKKSKTRNSISKHQYLSNKHFCARLADTCLNAMVSCDLTLHFCCSWVTTTRKQRLLSRRLLHDPHLTSAFLFKRSFDAFEAPALYATILMCVLQFILIS